MDIICIFVEHSGLVCSTGDIRASCWSISSSRFSLLVYMNNRLNPCLSTGLIKIDLFQHYRKSNDEDVKCQGQHNCHICFSAPTYKLNIKFLL